MEVYGMILIAFGVHPAIAFGVTLLLYSPAAH